MPRYVTAAQGKHMKHSRRNIANKRAKVEKRTKSAPPVSKYAAKRGRGIPVVNMDFGEPELRWPMHFKGDEQ